MYCEGNLEVLNSPCFSIVGSRDLTDYGRRIEKWIVRDLSLRGITIVSGMAVGADSVAHQVTLDNGGKTIAVLGCGFNHIFPEENIDLYQRIVREGGLVISEYSPETEAKSAYFPKRNRIVSGLSKGVLVVEAKYRSGTSITARLAKEQGKKVFALPGRLDNKNGVGVNKLIKEGASMVISPNDIIDEIPEFQSLVKTNIRQNSSVKKEYRKIYSLLNDEPMTLDEISLKTKNDIKCTLNLLTLMELEDLVEEIVGARLCQEVSKVKTN